MTITRYTSDWNPAMAILAIYGLVGLVLILVPVPTHGIFPPIQQLPMIKAMQHQSFNSLRFVFFWQWMVIVFPVLFAAFSWVAPVKVNESKANKAYAIPLSLLGIIFFGLCVPGFVWALFFTEVNTPSRANQIILNAASSPWNLCYAGDVLMIMFLVLTWWAYVAIPISMYKVIKLRAQHKPQGS